MCFQYQEMTVISTNILTQGHPNPTRESSFKISKMFRN